MILLLCAEISVVDEQTDASGGLSTIVVIVIAVVGALLVIVLVIIVAVCIIRKTSMVKFKPKQRRHIEHSM